MRLWPEAVPLRCGSAMRRFDSLPDIIQEAGEKDNDKKESRPSGFVAGLHVPTLTEALEFTYTLIPGWHRTQKFKFDLTDTEKPAGMSIEYSYKCATAGYRMMS